MNGLVNDKMEILVFSATYNIWQIFLLFFFISQANYIEFNSYTSSYTRENDESGARGRNETKKPTGAASFYKIEKRSADTHVERKRGRKRKRDYPRVGMKSLDELIKK